MKPLPWRFKGIWGVLAGAAESRPCSAHPGSGEGGNPSPAGSDHFTYSLKHKCIAKIQCEITSGSSGGIGRGGEPRSGGLWVFLIPY